MQSIEVVAGKDGTKVSVNMGDSNVSEQTTNAADMTPPENFVYESAYDDGEPVAYTNLTLPTNREEQHSTLPAHIKKK